MKAVSGNGGFSSGELADSAGVSRDTLRHYERKGVLARPLRGHNGYRKICWNRCPSIRNVQTIQSNAKGEVSDENTFWTSSSGFIDSRDRGANDCLRAGAEG